MTTVEQEANRLISEHRLYINAQPMRESFKEAENRAIQSAIITATTARDSHIEATFHYELYDEVIIHLKNML